MRNSDKDDENNNERMRREIKDFRESVRCDVICEVT